ncbi:cobalamin-binding protein [Halorhabdus sp. CBA1104]|uniref:helical backbone metal receptor n=1 Tax=Halorhabdus sp. CBA1104 TaxID=1380432 RepID=UPI0012B259CF|nr:helical backbone metal receptor [Halorhabdus sp. CBA1104]QGN08087.1 cobalamin-binding protein [Halorhabdus sp. CBA1104]
MQRIVSLAPSATAIVRALGRDEQLVGVTAHCGLEEVSQIGGWLNPDVGAIAELDPDLLLTNDSLQAELRDELRDRGFDVAHEEPTTLDDVLTSFRTIGDAIGRPDRGARLEQRAREYVAAVDAATPDGEDRPVVYCEEWGEPPMAAGNWVPEAVRVAGGRYPFVESGERSREITGTTVEDVDPDHAIVHHCGAAEPTVAPLEARDWEIDATLQAIDDSLLNQPSPTLLAGIERLARVIGGVAPGELPRKPRTVDG